MGVVSGAGAEKIQRRSPSVGSNLEGGGTTPERGAATTAT